MLFGRFEKLDQEIKKLELIVEDMNCCVEKIKLIDELKKLINEPIDIKSILFNDQYRQGNNK